MEDADLSADAADLERLAQWTRRWCPWVQSDGMDGLLLDTTGASHLHGGEAAMLLGMERAFARAGLTARIAAAPTIGAAWALAHHAAEARVSCGAPELAHRLAPLPAAALRLDAETVLLLKRLGLKTVGDLDAVPRPALIRRFRRIEAVEANPVLRLDQATGRLAEPLMPQGETPPLRALLRLAEPVGELDGLTRLLADLAADLARRLEREERGARALVFTAYRVDGNALSLEARTGLATREAAHMVRLFGERLATLDPGFGIEAATLEAAVSEPLGGVQDDLTGAGEAALDMARLIDRLSVRLGSGHVVRPIPAGSHMPERGERLLPAGTVEAAGAVEAAGFGESAAHPVQRDFLPLRLLPRPEEAEVVHAVPEGPPARFRWRRRLHDVARSQGPERIAPEWWREKSSARLRDYYRVEVADGRRFWLYREGLAGDGRGGTPRWYVHGLDA